MRDRAEEIRRLGAEWVVIGNGAQPFARAFREDFALDGPLLVDPELVAYRAAGLRRGRVEALSPRVGWNALRALRRGFRQGAVQGDPWQLGGVFVIRPDGALTFRHASREAGDHPPVEEILAALEPDAPAVDESPARGLLEGAALGALGRGLALLVDPTIVLSFSRAGFRVHSLAFRPEDLDVDLGGRRALVTGANSGIGFETSLALADLGAEVVMLCRSAERGAAAAAAVRERTGSGRVRVETCDVASLASVREAAARAGDGRVDVLVHNAGVLPARRALSEDGLELTFATHVAGPHLLTKLLRPALARSGDARVVFVSSGGMYTRKLQLEDPQWEARAGDYDGTLAYAETKRGQVVLARLWAEALEKDGVAVNSMHPGWADTPSVASSIPAFYRLTKPILRTPAEGADTVIWLAAAGRARELHGEFVFDRAARLGHLLPWTRESEPERRAYWELCERATGSPP